MRMVVLHHGFHGSPDLGHVTGHENEVAFVAAQIGDVAGEDRFGMEAQLFHGLAGAGLIASGGVRTGADGSALISASIPFSSFVLAPFRFDLKPRR